MMKLSLYDFCIENGKEAILESWDAEKNGNWRPQDVSYGTHQKFWWLCERGHSWKALVYSRTGGSGCPYCSGRKVWPGENDLATLKPEIAAEWHPTKNGALTPAQVTVGNHRRVWWRCAKGHEWQAMVKTRVGGTGCPVCANRVVVPGVNDLATERPELAAEWVREKNDILPTDVTVGSRRRVWWCCEKGHQWRSEVSSRARGAGCPVCASRAVVAEENDLMSHFPEIAAEWHPTKNGQLQPDAVSPSSNRKVWWLCPEGHDYQAAVGARTGGGSGCPYCAGRKVWLGFNDLATLEPRLAEEWHPTLNGKLTPEDVTPGSRRKVWWLCSEGHSWKAVIYSRARGRRSGCPVCAGKTKITVNVRTAAEAARNQT